jgi:hypothetical protein
LQGEGLLTITIIHVEEEGEHWEMMIIINEGEEIE